MLQSNSYYFHTGNIVVKKSSVTDNVVIFSLLDVEVRTGVTQMTHAIIVAANEVRLQGGANLNAPLPHPAIISGGTVDQSSGNVEVTGNVYSAGAIDLNPNSVHGLLIGNPVEIQGGAGTLYTDDNPQFYDFMPGFDYPKSTLTTSVVADSWQEIQ